MYCAIRQADYNFRRSYKERTGDAWASTGEEGRGKLRQAAGICKRELIRRYPNGTTHHVEDMILH